MYVPGRYWPFTSQHKGSRKGSRYENDLLVLIILLAASTAFAIFRIGHKKPLEELEKKAEAEKERETGQTTEEIGANEDTLDHNQ
jgi:flagellar basal body-associated protein FliL